MTPGDIVDHPIVQASAPEDVERRRTAYAPVRVVCVREYAPGVRAIVAREPIGRVWTWFEGDDACGTISTCWSDVLAVQELDREIQLRSER